MNVLLLEKDGKMRIGKNEDKTCECCGNTERIFQTKYVCDTCGKILRDFGENNSDWLIMTAFYNSPSDQTEDFDYCSWRCCFSGLEKVSEKDIDFVDLPYLSKNQPDGKKIFDFLKLLPKSNKTENL